MTLRSDLAFISDWVKPHSHVLDLGCGDGKLLAHLQQTRQVTGYGLEIDEEMIATCISAGINVIHTDVNKGLGNFADKDFDYVIMAQALQVVTKPDILLREMLRVGREGIVTFPNFGHYKCRFPLLFQGRMPISATLPKQWYNTENIHLCTLHDFESLCEELGIEVLQRAVVKHSTLQPTFMAKVLPNLFGETAIYRIQLK